MLKTFMRTQSTHVLAVPLYPHSSAGVHGLWLQVCSEAVCNKTWTKQTQDLILASQTP